MSNTILKLTLRTPMVPDKHSKKTRPHGKPDPRESKTCTPLPGTIKSPKLNSPQLPTSMPLTSSSQTQLKFPTTIELPLKLTKISVKKSRTISQTSTKQLHQPEVSSRTKLTANGFHKPKRSTDLTSLSLRKFSDSHKLMPKKNLMHSIKV